MNIFDFLTNWFSKKSDKPTYATGVLLDHEDERDVVLGAFQKPVGAPANSSDEVLKILLSLPTFDQMQQPACVPHALVKVLIAYIFKKTGQRLKLSPRLLYKLCKMFDGVPNTEGTYPRIGALMFSKFGTCLEDLVDNDTSLSKSDYLAVNLIQSVLENAKQFTIPAFATFNPNDNEALKEAILQNGIVSIAMSVGDWSSLPLKKGSGLYWHYVNAFKYETINGRLKVYIDNSWGTGWMSWVKNWMYPGKGYFYFDEYIGGLANGIVITEIPADYLNYVKSTPYKFTQYLRTGVTHPSVKYLQKMLNENPNTLVALDGAGSHGYETDYFGLATRDALVRWQSLNGISPATGFFGPLSIAQANKRIPKMMIEQAIILQESGGNDYAIGDIKLTNKAYGPMQIRKPYVDDVNARLGTNYKAEDCLGNRELSLKIFHAYVSIYEPHGTDEEISRLHNAGPNWRNKLSSTDLYWASINKKLNS